MHRALLPLSLMVLMFTGCTTVASQKYMAFGYYGQTQDQNFIDSGFCEQKAQSGKRSDADEALVMGSMGLVIGAASGAAWGAILGAVGHGMSAGSGSLAGLAVGGVFGLTVGVVNAIRENQMRYERIYVACMESKFYRLGG